jgi:hypothetical protein
MLVSSAYPKDPSLVLAEGKLDIVLYDDDPDVDRTPVLMVKPEPTLIPPRVVADAVGKT